MKTQFFIFLILLPFATLSQEANKKKHNFGFELAGLHPISGSYSEYTNFGSSVRATASYSISPLLCIGLCAGVTTYYKKVSSTSFPLEIETRGFLLKKHSTPFVILRAGYSFTPTSNDGYGANGSVGAGYRFSIGKNARCMPSIGVCYLNAHEWTSPLESNATETTTQTSLYFGIRFEW